MPPAPLIHFNTGVRQAFLPAEVVLEVETWVTYDPQTMKILCARRTLLLRLRQPGWAQGCLGT